MSDQTAEAGRFLPNLENAVNPKSFFLLAVYTLFVDCALIKIQGQGLIDYAQAPEGLKSSFALTVFLLFVLFSFLMALIMRGVSHLLNDVVLNFVCNPWCAFADWLARQLGQARSEPRGNRAAMNCVTLSELNRKAHTTQDSYYLNLLKTERDNERTQDESNYTTRFFAVAALVAATYNFCFLDARSLLNHCTDFLGHPGWGWGFLLLIAGNAFRFLFTPYEPRWVSCPPLYKELRDAERKNRKDDDFLPSYLRAPEN
jgi:hypothetical protein